MPSRILTATSVVLLTLLLAAGVTRAQDQPRSDTGRHQAAPPPEEEPAGDPETDQASRPRQANWFLVFGAGLAGGSDLFRAETVNGAPVFWPGSPFQTSDVYVKLDPGLALTAGLGRRLGSLVSVKADFTWTELDGVSESSLGQVGDIYVYDRFGIFEICLGAEVRLVRQPSAPYLGLGVCWMDFSPAREDDLAQQYLAGRISLGYEHMMNQKWSLRLEGRLTHGGFTTDGYVPVTSPPTEVVVEGEDSLTIWQLLLGVQLEL